MDSSPPVDTIAPSPRRRTCWPGWCQDAVVVLLLCALIVALYWRIALAGRVLAAGDAYLYFYPYWAEATRALHSGRLPLWNPYLFMGVPFLANSQVGLFYPINWLLWLVLPAHLSMHVSIVVHLCLAALNAYLWARGALHLARPWAGLTAAVFALGGYLGAQVEHVNQLQGLAWMPLALLLAGHTAVPHPGTARPRPARAAVLLALVVALQLVTGHTQVAFITAVGVVFSVLAPPVWRWCQGVCARHSSPVGSVRRWGWAALLLVAALGVGALLAGVQLLPTFELQRLSIRAKGLPFEERVSFSLSPLYLARALLPTYGTTPAPAHLEHVAYFGIAGLVLAALALVRKPTAGADGSRQPTPLPALLIAGLGLFLALGGYNPLYLLLARFAPGFAHFRVPARWLALAALGIAGLAGIGGSQVWSGLAGRLTRRCLVWVGAGLLVVVGWAVQGPRLQEGAAVSSRTIVGWLVAGGLMLALVWWAKRRPRPATVAMIALLAAELWLSAARLPHARATAPQAVTGLRPAVAHLQATARPVDRFLSMSDITFDPGDLAEIGVIYGPQLPDEALYDYIVSAKLREVLSPNLSLAYGLAAVDGYDGGVLPLERYVILQRLVLPAEQVSLDGRLRENLQGLPEGRWLNLFRVRHIITDKLRDAWLDDVFYDLQFGARLAQGEAASVAWVPPFEATALGLVSYLEGAAELPTGAVVGTVEIAFADGLTRTFDVRAGDHTSEGRYDSQVAHAQAPIGGHYWPGEPEGNDYTTRLHWDEAVPPSAIRVLATLPRGTLVIRGVSLIDERTGGFQALVVSDQNRLRLAHSGDVKLYENDDVLPQAFVVYCASAAPDAEAALATMQSPDFEPGVEVVLEGPKAIAIPAQPSAPAAPEPVRTVRNEPEHLEFEITATAPGYLVVTDSWFPGWQATVDGDPVPILRADVLFRAVYVEPGVHRVALDFRPASLRWGAGTSLLGLLGLVGLAVFMRRCPKARNML